MTDDSKILIVDDEERLRISLGKMLSLDGFAVSTASDGQEGLDSLMDNPCDLVIVDLVMPGRDGMWLIREIKERKIDVGIIVATGYGTVDLAVNAMKLGAWDFIQKPVDYDLMKMVAERALERVRLVRDKAEAEKRIKLQNEELKKINKKLKDLDKLKTNFLSKAVHELRSPLTVIACGLEIVREELEERGDAEMQQYLEHAIAFTNSMVKIVNDMLDINMIVSGKIHLERVKGDFVSVVKGTAEGILPFFRKEGLVLEINIPERMIEAEFSRDRIMQVLTNLLSNAAKFTTEGGKVIVSVDDGADDIVCSVHDTGQGIPAEDLDSVFEEFFQVKRGDKRGAGLGLSICKKIIESHGGRIWVESELGKGTTFYFSIPKHFSRKNE